MRYALFDTNQEYVNLEKEIDFIKKYIELEKLRLAKDSPVEINLQLNGSFDNYEVAPMILVPFVENAFKYGITFTKRSFINISIMVEDEYLLLNVKNSINKNASGTGGSGIGLKNVKDRLDILHRDKYDLQVTNTADQYNVHLKIRLK